MKRWLVLLLLAVVSTVSCDRGERPVAANNAAAAARAADDDATPQDGGTVVRRLETDVSGLNPILAVSVYDRQVAQYLFTPLLYLDADLRPIAGLAETWDVSSDGLRYTFHLNEKATFSDGKPVRASDVLFTMRKIVDPAGEAIQIAGYFDLLDLAKSRVVDENTVELAFRERLASQLSKFAEVLVLPEHVYGRGNFTKDFNNIAVGSGPYRVAKFEPGNQIVVERRADYWDRKPYLQTVVFKIISDNATALNALKRGDIDESQLQSETWVRERNDRALQQKIDFRRFYTLNYNYVAWNTRHPLLGDKRVRRALAMCLPIDAVINDLYHGTARAMSGPFTPDEWAYNPTVPVVRYDPDGAKRLLASVGWLDQNRDGILDRNGKPFKFDLLVMAGGGTTMQFAQLLQSELRKIGVQMAIAVIEANVALQRITAGNYEAAYLGWTLDAEPDLFPIFHSSQFPPRGHNFVFYANPEIDRLLESARRELDQSKRKVTYQQVHAMLAEDQPYLWIVQVSTKWGVNKRLKGVNLSAATGPFLWYPGELDWWIPRDQRTHDRAAR